MLVHVGSVMSTVRPMPPAGTGTVADNLQLFIDGGLEVLTRISPAFAGLLSQPKVLSRFYKMAGGGAAFGAAAADAPGASRPGHPRAEPGDQPGGQRAGPADAGGQAGRLAETVLSGIAPPRRRQAGRP